jgi:NAD(P)H-nitrite reductase large subunit
VGVTEIAHECQILDRRDGTGTPVVAGFDLPVKLVIRDGRLTGAVLFGDTADGLWYLDLIRSGADVSHWRDVRAFGPALALPQAA